MACVGRKEIAFIITDIFDWRRNLVLTLKIKLHVTVIVSTARSFPKSSILRKLFNEKRENLPK